MLTKAKGFTLVELLVVMGIIIILVSIAIPAANTARNKAKDTEVKSGCNQIQVALESYAVDHASNYPGVHWEVDTNNMYYAGPGVIGALPTYDGMGNPHKDFYVPKTADDTRGPDDLAPYMADDTPNPEILDELVVSGYLTDYPANPFLATTGSSKAQMSNLFLFDPIEGDTAPDPTRPDTLNWNRYTITQSMREQYMDFGRGHFSYIPLNPVNNTGTDFVGQWTSLNGIQLSEYYKRCRGYILVGWGNNRLDDSMAKGLSEKYWNTTVDNDYTSTQGAFDFDNSLTADQLEEYLSVPGDLWLRDEMRDSAGSYGAFGQGLPGGGVDIDQAFYGAAFFKITGS
jgi:prepilin-type N-terminal cleavage/methylation domain-containing protein